MQWDAGPQAGFSSNAHTWLPVTADYPQLNVQRESTDPESLLNWYRRLIALRRSNEALRSGRMVMLDAGNPNVLSYARVSAGETVIVSLNMSAQPQSVTLGLAQAGLRGVRLRTLLSGPGTAANADASQPLKLLPYASYLAELRER
jgi:alpha-glucosidase